jgi:hypothetical protein
MAQSQPQPADPQAPRQLVLVKQDQRWVFRYAPGEEPQVLAWLAQTADDPDTTFDWFDAAVLSYQLGHQLSRGLDPIAQLD